MSRSMGSSMGQSVTVRPHKKMSWGGLDSLMPHSIKCSFHFRMHGHNSAYGRAQVECEAKLVNHLPTAWPSRPPPSPLPIRR